MKRVHKNHEHDSIIGAEDLEMDTDQRGQKSEKLITTMRSGQYFGELAVTG
jgi:hypothetical protein